MKKKCEGKIRINVGCGQTPTEGWRNFDNSFSLRLAKMPFIPNLLYRIGLVGDAQIKFIHFTRDKGIDYGDATKGLPVPPDSCQVVYSSHMLEHLDRDDADAFIREVRRVLSPGGVI